MEIWKEIPTYDNYKISNEGRLMSYTKTKPRLLKPWVDRKGYLYYSLVKDGVKKIKLAHRLVAEAFIDRVDGKNTVDHIDRDKTNNCIENLRWANYSEQRINSNSGAKKTPVSIFDENMQNILDFESQTECARHLNVPQVLVMRAIKSGNFNVLNYYVKYKKTSD